MNCHLTHGVMLMFLSFEPLLRRYFPSENYLNGILRMADLTASVSVLKLRSRILRLQLSNLAATASLAIPESRFKSGICSQKVPCMQHPG